MNSRSVLPRQLADPLRAWWRAAVVDHERGRTFALGATAAYLALLIVAHVLHECWRDEIHFWIVARHTDGLHDMLFGIRRYEGHPILWYLVLYLAARVTSSVVGLHAVTIALATGAAYLWLRCAPLPRVIRVLALASYFLVFEYPVICRSYILGIVILFAFCAVYDRRAPRYLLSSFLLLLLAATSVYGTIIAASLALFVALQALARPKPSASSSTAAQATSGATMGATPRAWPRFWIGAALFALGLVLVVVNTMPPPDAFFAPVWKTDLRRQNLADALLRFWIAFFPVSPGRGGWDVATSGLGVGVAGFLPLVPWLAGGLFAACLFAMRRAWPTAVAYAAIVVLMSLFQEMRNLGDLRHWGHFVIALLACLWLAYKERRPTGRERQLVYAALTAVLGFGAVTGFITLRADFVHPFSGAAQAARFIERAGLRDAAFVGSHDHLASNVAGYLDRPFASGNNEEIGYSVVLHNRRHTVNAETVFRLSRNFLAENPARPVVLIMSWDLPVHAVPADLHLEHLFVTDRALHPEERYRIYRVRRRP